MLPVPKWKNGSGNVRYGFISLQGTDDLQGRKPDKGKRGRQMALAPARIWRCPKLSTDERKRHLEHRRRMLRDNSTLVPGLALPAHEGQSDRSQNAREQQREQIDGQAAGDGRL